MKGVSRRAALSTFVGGAAIGSLSTAAILRDDLWRNRPAPAWQLMPKEAKGAVRKLPVKGRPAPEAKLPKGDNPTKRENRAKGSIDWTLTANGTTASDDHHKQVQGYASATSVNVGESIDFHVTVKDAPTFTITIYRLGYYGGLGARLLTESPALPRVRQPAPTVDKETGLVECDWSVSWTLKIPREWISGQYLAVFTAGGHKGSTRFVVRNDARKAELCVVLPYTTYQAYNQWPKDGRTGTSLYKGYAPGAQAKVDPPAGVAKWRATKVSFNRPFPGGGEPERCSLDDDFIRWVENCGYDVTYASGLDLESGRIKPDQYSGFIFSGHDEYWSARMRKFIVDAIAKDTSVAFMTSNNIYWHIRFEKSESTDDNRVFACYKTDPDPKPESAGGPTKLWRDLKADGSLSEQALLGAGLIGTMAKPWPLIVTAADSWFWEGCGVADGDAIPKIVEAEADGFDPALPGPVGVKHTLLSASPFILRNKKKGVHNASLYETRNGAVVFNSGTFNWPYGLNNHLYVDARIQEATANLLNRMRRPKR